MVVDWSFTRIVFQWPSCLVCLGFFLFMECLSIGLVWENVFFLVILMLIFTLSSVCPKALLFCSWLCSHSFWRNNWLGIIVMCFSSQGWTIYAEVCTLSSWSLQLSLWMVEVRSAYSLSRGLLVQWCSYCFFFIEHSKYKEILNRGDL